jgi:TusA-related sulfurtransferase
MTLPLVAHQVLDVLGYFCPIPVIRASRAVSRLRVGEVLELISDDRGVLADIPDWCVGHGHTYLGHRVAGRTYHLFIQKG